MMLYKKSIPFFVISFYVGDVSMRSGNTNPCCWSCGTDPGCNRGKEVKLIKMFNETMNDIELNILRK